MWDLFVLIPDHCLSIYFVPVGETVNGIYHAEFLRPKLRPAIRKK